MCLRKINLVLLFSCIALGVPTTATSGTPAQDFNDNKLVELAATDIQEMAQKELESLVDYLASCHALATGDAKTFYCEKNRRSFEMKYGRQRAVDRLLFVLHITWQVIGAEDRASKPNSKEKMKVNDKIMRYSEVTRILESAITRSYSRFLKR